MHLTNTFILLLAPAAALAASYDDFAHAHANGVGALRHLRVARSIDNESNVSAREDTNALTVGTLAKRRTHSKRCLPKGAKVIKPKTTSSATPTPTPTPSPSPKPKAKPAAPKVAAAAPGTLKMTSSSCGSPGATSWITPTSGPNGNIDWLNCGIADGGWNPPYVSIDQLSVKDLNDALASPNNPFKGCGAYVDLFYKYGGMYGIPPIFLASFAMQESTCNANAPGGGLMQITSDKCGGAPGGDCNDPDFNVHAGAKYFKSVLDSNGGSVLLSIGNYNGWNSGMTLGQAKDWLGGSCHNQRNLDYLMQFLNGWAQGVDAYAKGLGKYWNLNVC